MAVPRIPVRSTYRERPSWLRRVLLWVVLPLAVIYFVIWWRVNAAVDRIFDSAAAYARIDHGSAFVGLNGDVGVRSVYIRGDADLNRPSLSAAHLTLHTPSLLWVVKTGLFGMSAMPERFGFSVDDLEIGLEEGLVASDSVIGTYTAALFDAAGCVDHTVTRAELGEFGIANANADAHFDYALGTGNEMTITAVQDVEGVAQVKGVAQITLAADPRTNPAAWMGATIRGFQLTMLDQGFAAARLSTCANRLKLSPDAFIDRHIVAAKAILRAHGLALGDAEWDQYRRFATSGGSLSLTGAASAPVPITAFDNDAWENFSLALRDGTGNTRAVTFQTVTPVALPGTGPALTLEQEIALEDKLAREEAARIHAGEAPRPTGATRPTTSGSTPSGVTGSASDTAATDSSAAVASANERPQSMQSVKRPIASDPAADTARLPATTPLATATTQPEAKAGEYVTVDYAALDQHIGQPVRIETVHGTVRTGTLEKHSRFNVSVKLGPRDGGIVLSIAANEVRKAAVAPAAPVATPGTTPPAPATTPKS
jgi:hypothetical protein